VNLKEVVENLIDNFLEAGDLAIQLREKGLVKKIKSDNTPVSNGDLEVNKFISKKFLRLLLIYLSFQRRPLKIKIT
jgi:3'(2'), 5'-bisphosphate nucleotidase